MTEIQLQEHPGASEAQESAPGYSDRMATIEVSDVPDDVLSKLRERADKKDQSLQDYLLDHLTEFARHETLEEIFERIDTYSGGNFTAEDAVAAIREDRESH